MIWDKDMLKGVMSIRTQLGVDALTLAQSKRRDDLLNGIHFRLFQRINDMANSWAVDLIEDDIRVRAIPGDTQVMYVAWWEPVTRLAEFVGGPQGGAVGTVRSIADAVLGYVEPRLMGPEDEVVANPPVFYDLSGWNENTRRWVFEVRAKRTAP